MIHIALADSQRELEHCFPIMQGLRPHLINLAEFVERVQRQQAYGYRLAYLTVAELEADALGLKEIETDGLAAAAIKAVAGFRVSENLAWGKFLYVDDLVTAGAERSKGYGEQLLHWLIDYARRQQCQSLQLDSGVQRFAAHRFYFRHRLEITSYHFTLVL